MESQIMNILIISDAILVFASMLLFSFVIISSRSNHLVYRSFMKYIIIALFLFSLSKVAYFYNFELIESILSLIALLFLISSMFAKTTSFFENEFKY